MKLIRGLFRLFFRLMEAVFVFLLAGVLTIFFWYMVSGRSQGFPEVHSLQDLQLLIRTMAESLNIPAVSQFFETVTPAQTVYQPSVTFDERFYPYYGLLDDDGKLVYAQLYENAMNMRDSFFPAVSGLSTEKAEEIWMSVYEDHPELFWLEESCSFTYLSTGQVTEIHLSFNDLARNIDESRAKFDQSVSAVLSEASQYTSEQNKELAVHDALARMIEYDETTRYHQSAYSALVDGRSVCAGYARAFQLILTRAGIPCWYVTGWSGENHGWNIVELEGDLYDVDLTWDDTTNTHAFFNRTDEDLRATHIRRDLSVKLPECFGGKWNNTEPIPELVFD